VPGFGQHSRYLIPCQPIKLLHKQAKLPVVPAACLLAPYRVQLTAVQQEAHHQLVITKVASYINRTPSPELQDVVLQAPETEFHVGPAADYPG
jgi:hypothetical protein